MRRAAWVALVTAGMTACFSLDGFSGGADGGASSDGGGTPEATVIPPASDAASDADGALIADASPSTCGVAGPTEGLLAYYPFDDDGDTSTDCSGHGLTGTFVNAAPDGGSRGPGVHGGAIHVTSDVKTGCVDLGLAPSLQTEPFTIAVWLKVDIFPNTPTTGATGYVIGQSSNATFNGWRIATTGDGNGSNDLQWEQGSADGASTATNASWPSDGAWHHYALIVQPNAINAYIDGTSASATGASFPLAFSTVAMRIGCREDNGNYYDGFIDELRFYGRVLTMTEIAGLAKQ